MSVSGALVISFEISYLPKNLIFQPKMFSNEFHLKTAKNNILEKGFL